MSLVQGFFYFYIWFMGVKFINVKRYKCQLCGNKDLGDDFLIMKFRKKYFIPLFSQL